MKNPVHPGALAKANLEELGLSVTKGKSAVCPAMALRFEQAFGGSADMWLRMQVAYDLADSRKHQPKMNIPRLIENRLACTRKFSLTSARRNPG